MGYLTVKQGTILLWAIQVINAFTHLHPAIVYVTNFFGFPWLGMHQAKLEAYV